MHYTVPYSTILYYILLYYTILYYLILYDTFCSSRPKKLALSLVPLSLSPASSLGNAPREGQSAACVKPSLVAASSPPLETHYLNPKSNTSQTPIQTLNPSSTPKAPKAPNPSLETLTPKASTALNSEWPESDGVLWTSRTHGRTSNRACDSFLGQRILHHLYTFFIYFSSYLFIYL